MARSNETVARGVNFTTTFTTYSSAGAPVAPDSAPTISIIHKNGAVTTVASSAITQLQDSVPANITGYYLLTVPTSTLAVNDQIDVRVTATIAGAVRFQTFSFTVIDTTGSLPYID
jgi:hypothetical protein